MTVSENEPVEQIGDVAFDPSLWTDDLAIVNASVITLDPSRPNARAVLVQRGRITLVGTDEEVRAAAPDVKTIDARGRALVPGFIDSHVHIEWTAATLNLLENFWDDKEPKSIAEVLDKLRARAQRTPPGEWIVAEGNVAFAVEEKRLPTMAEMDSVSQSHFVVLIDQIHAHTANTLATTAMGYRTTADEVHMREPQTGHFHSGGQVARDEHGCPLGAYDLFTRLPRDLWSIAELKGAIQEMVAYNFTQGGVTSASPIALFNANEYVAEQQLHAEGELPLRLRAMWVTPGTVDIEPVMNAGIARGTGNDMFRFGGVKIFVDGARAGGGSIVLSSDDVDSGNDLVAAAASARQIFAYTRDQLAAQLARIQLKGFPVMMHCLSDEGVELVTAAVEDLRQLKVGQELNHRIEHWKPPMELWDRMRDASLYFSIIANHPDYDPEWGQSLDTPYKSYVDRGLKPVLISDRCGGYSAPVRPLFSITRACLSIDDGGEATAGNELHFDDALKMWTLWAAESTHQLTDRGTISVGKLGDLVLLTADPASMSPHELLDLGVDATILGGKVVHGGE